VPNLLAAIRMDQKLRRWASARANVERALALRAAQGPRTIVQGLLQEVDVFVAGQRSLDDITLIAVQKTA
jgi:serine phosphatase RsbU (regulator of sigma subunit)